MLMNREHSSQTQIVSGQNPIQEAILCLQAPLLLNFPMALPASVANLPLVSLEKDSLKSQAVSKPITYLPVVGHVVCFRDGSK